MGCLERRDFGERGCPSPDVGGPQNQGTHIPCSPELKGAYVSAAAVAVTKFFSNCMPQDWLFSG